MECRELRHDRHMVSLPTDHTVFSPKYRGKILVRDVTLAPDGIIRKSCIKENMKKLISIVLILTVVLSMGCLKSGVEGKYVSTDNPGTYRELNSDGTFFADQGDYRSVSGTYKVKDNKIRFILPSGSTFESRIEGNKIIDWDGEVWQKV